MVKIQRGALARALNLSSSSETTGQTNESLLGFPYGGNRRGGGLSSLVRSTRPFGLAARAMSDVFKRRFAQRAASYPHAVARQGFQCPFCMFKCKRRRDLINHSPLCKVYAS